MSGEFREGDRIEWVGEDSEGWGPRKGERGWLEAIDPMDDIVLWDDHGIDTGDYVHDPRARAMISKVGDRNEPDPAKRREHDPFGDTETCPRPDRLVEPVDDQEQYSHQDRADACADRPSDVSARHPDPFVIFILSSLWHPSELPGCDQRE
jgi:hypothetical protein